MSKIELAKSKLAALKDELAALEAEEARVKKLRVAVEKALKEGGFDSPISLIEAFPEIRRTRRPAAAGTVYTNPENPKETWSGRGRRPAWMKKMLSEATDSPEA